MELPYSTHHSHNDVGPGNVESIPHESISADYLFSVNRSEKAHRICSHSEDIRLRPLHDRRVLPVRQAARACRWSGTLMRLDALPTFFLRTINTPAHDRTMAAW